MAWQTVLEMGVYLVEPDDEGPAMSGGQKFHYTLPDPRKSKVWSDLKEEKQRTEMEQYEATHGEWFVEDVYWNLERGIWIQHIVLNRNKPRTRR